jgi:hypothetical protein
MRLSLLTLGLLAALPIHAQDLVRYWYFDVHQTKPTLEGHFEGKQDGNDFRMDLKDDLALAKDKTKIGFAVEYQGPRFGLELSMDGQDYLGTNMVNKKVSINGQTWTAGARLTTSVKATNTTFNWTIRALTWPQFWIGVDLGVRGMGVDLKASGIEPFTQVQASAGYKITIPIPQLGLSTGFNAFGGRLIGRGFYHYLGYSGASYSHIGADLRYFPVQWLGVRAFTDTESFKIPKGSAKQDADIGLDRAGTGFGVVVRF